MRLFLSLILAIVVMAQPAVAGTPDTPEITDPCGQLEVTDPAYVQPQNDICSAWFTSDITGAAPALSITVRTLEPTVERARVVRASWTAGDCRWTATFDDAVASPRSVVVHEGAATVFPNSDTVGLRVACDPYTVPCDPDPGIGTCTSGGYERSGWVALPADAVVVDGTDVTLTVDLAGLDPSGDEVDDATFAPGDTLTDLSVLVNTTPTGLFTLTGGAWAAVGSTGLYFTTSDEAVGDSSSLPVQDQEA